MKFTLKCVLSKVMKGPCDLAVSFARVSKIQSELSKMTILNQNLRLDYTVFKNNEFSKYFFFILFLRYFQYGDMCPEWDTFINPLAPNNIYIYISRTTQLNSRRCILDIYSTNILTEYFKHAAHSQFFLFKMQFIS